VNAGYLCAECLRERSAPEPPKALAVVSCDECGKVKRGPEWTANLKTAVERLARSAASAAGGRMLSATPEIDPESETSGVARIALEVALEGERGGDLPAGFEYEWSVPLKVARGLCSDCSRKRGGYWEAIIQLRAAGIEDEDHASVVDVLGKIVAGKDRNAFVSKVEVVRGGVDVYLGSWRLADRISREIAARTGAEVKSSKKLHTHRDGKDIYRSTFLIRYPDLVIGDIFRHEGRHYVLLGLLKKGVRARDLLTGETVTVEERLATLRLAAKMEDVRPAIAISEARGEIEILDPESYEMVSLEAPPARVARDVPATPGTGEPRGRSFKSKEVRVVRIDGRLYLYE
jgi:nonsense-mediated mRNA decay protein 3